MRVFRWLVVTGVVLSAMGALSAVPAQAAPPSVTASKAVATKIALLKCLSREQKILYVTFVECYKAGASNCHVPTYAPNKVFCVGWFWLRHIFSDKEWEFCTRSLYFKQGANGPVVTDPLYGWSCDYPGHGPINT